MEKKIDVQTTIYEDHISRWLDIGYTGDESSTVDACLEVVNSELRDCLSKMIVKESTINDIMTTVKTLLNAIKGIPLNRARLNASKEIFIREDNNKTATYEVIDITVTKYGYMNTRDRVKETPGYDVRIRLTKKRK